MKQYLLSIYQPDGEAPPPAVREKVMRDMTALLEDAKAAGVWVFNGGLHPPTRPRGSLRRSDSARAPARRIAAAGPGSARPLCTHASDRGSPIQPDDVRAPAARRYTPRSDRAISPSPPNNSPSITSVLKSVVWRK